MQKYSPLRNHLLKLRDTSWKASFTELEDVLGFPLPKSARHYPAWWANQSYGAQCKAWLDAGWVTSDVNLGNETIVFRKSVERKISLKKPKEHSGISYDWDGAEEIRCNVKMQWRPMGGLILESGQKLHFPKAEVLPAVYRFRIRKGNRHSLYVGETDNLKRRFGNYRNPSPSQQTSWRINAALVKALTEGAEISVSIIAEEIWIDRAGTWQRLDLHSKASRCFLENLAILDDGASDIENLNKARIR